MVIGVLSTKLAIYQATSLKDKRRVVKSIKDKIRHSFNVSIAETDALESMQSAVLTTAMVSNDGRFVQSCLQQVLNRIERNPHSSLLDFSIELI